MPERREPGILDRIVSARRASLGEIRSRVPLAAVRARAGDAPPARSLRKAIVDAPGIALIAEMKRASASAGDLDPELDPAAAARTYAGNGASAISVLTEPDFFRGGVEDIVAARRTSKHHGTPILQKDFVIDEYQVWEGRAHGADAILLIMGILEPNRYSDLLSLAHSLGMDALVEVFNVAELGAALKEQPRILGINNRNLHTLETSLQVFERLAPETPSGMPLVAESGMKTVEDVRRMGRAGAKAVLVGESLMRAGAGLPALIRALATA